MKIAINRKIDNLNMNKLNIIKLKAMEWLLRATFLSLFISISFCSIAQNILTNPEVKANAVIDTNKILIGQQTQIHLQITAPKNLLIQWPIIQDTLSENVEVIKLSEIDTIALGKDSLIKLNQTITISSFDSGYFVIPPFYFMYAKANDSLNNYVDIVESNPLLLEVHNVKVDLKKEIKDIKPIIGEPWTFREILPYLLIVLGVLILVILAIYIYKRKKQNKPIFSLPQKPKLPAHIIAIQKLDLLKDKKLWQSGAIKEFYSELTNIIREYIEGNMHFGAMEMISDDIISELVQHKIDEALLSETRDVLQTADLVKFAKVKPLADESDRAMKWGYLFVEQTKPKAVSNNDNSKSELEVEPTKTIDQ